MVTINNMEENINFPDGLVYFLPREAAPNWVKGSLAIDPKRFVAWMQANKDAMRINIKDGVEYQSFYFDLKEAKSGKGYAALNTYKPTSN